MNKVLLPAFLVSGLLSAVMLILFITGIISFDNKHIEALIDGNRQFVVKKYDKALEAYKVGLAKNPNDDKLNQNSGLAAYQLNNYEEALNYYSKADENVEKYLKSGNSCLKLGDKMEEQTGKLKFYQQAAEAYKQGIIKFPENIDLKYNYEYVLEKLNELQNQNDQNQDNQNQHNQNQQENNENQNQESQSEENQNNENQNEDSQNKEGENKDNQEGQENKQDSKEQDSKDDNGNESQGDKSDESNNEDKKDQNSGQDKEAIEQAQRVLEMLEQQEEESLKNNQEVKDSGKGGEHDW